ncbi:hypothetical protein F891_01314 [Acinetobacter sp. CIP 101966]|uniref:DUF2218 domain-containing protein n=1 Tax=Acinetobacter sp. CIP 101966 TaxID=1144662 RepID=UPI0002D04796|nr:DUF2218 domain-containing protein [Acinetobacter sp. CIP 101966]ENX28467.1 hypothetical protein F891_01314 [Acinetobacter sp. CIP 101966]
MKSIAHIQTQQASRIAKRLANHWKHKFNIDETEQNFLIHFPNAEVILAPEQDHLTVTIQSNADSTDLNKLKNVVLDHLIRMGQENLTADWQR